MFAVITRYHGATDARPSRVSARAGRHRLVTSWDAGLGVVDNHERAAQALCGRQG